MPTPEATLRHYARQQRFTAAAVVGARSTWARINPALLDRSWATAGPRLLTLTAGIQRAAALDGLTYVPQALAELDLEDAPLGRVDVRPLIGVASDGRPLGSLLREPLIRTKQLIGGGASTEAAMAGGLAALERIIATQVADAGRAAVGLGIAARPRMGYVRMLSTPSCSRCVVLAGKFFRFNQGFLRHPRCDCRHIPTTENVAGDLTTDPRKAIEAGQVTGLSKADHHAIVDDGADVGQVINARRRSNGMTTTEGTTRRGFAGKSLNGEVRLRPEAIYAQAATREEALGLLRRHGYLH